MTVKNMVEMVQQHHPNVGETQIIMWLNLAMDDVTDKTSFSDVKVIFSSDTKGNKNNNELEDIVNRIQ